MCLKRLRKTISKKKKYIKNKMKEKTKENKLKIRSYSLLTASFPGPVNARLIRDAAATIWKIKLVDD